MNAQRPSDPKDRLAQASRRVEALRETIDSPSPASAPSAAAANDRAAIRRELGRLRQEVDRVSAVLKGEISVNRRKIVELEHKLSELSAQVDAIYSSRIWKALAAAGGFLLWLSGRRAAAVSPPERNSAGGPPESHVAEEAERDSSGAASVAASALAAPVIECEYPPSETAARATERVEIRGWATSPSGVRHVEILVDGEPAVRPAPGGLTPAVAEQYPDHPGAMFAGFHAIWDTRSASAGLHRIEVRVTGGDGQVRTVQREMLVDGRSDYEVWIEENEPSEAEMLAMAAMSTQFSYQPVISIATPVYKTSLEILTRTVASVQRQAYPHWELCLVDDGSSESNLTAALDACARSDSRIKVRTLPSNVGIAQATNECLVLCSGEFAGFLDHDDELAPAALFEIARVLNENKDIDVFYTDEDRIDEEGRRSRPFFKPQWSPDLLRSFNYITHFLVCRRSLLAEVGGLRAGFDGSQDYDLVLRLSERTQRIHRIPKVLYHWRAVAGSVALQGLEAKPEAGEAGRRAVEEHVRRASEDAEVESIGPARYRVRYRFAAHDPVSIIMPTGGNMPKLEVALRSLIAKTAYSKYEVVVVDNSNQDEVSRLAATLREEGVPIRVLDHRDKPFNFSWLCNEAARASDSPFLLFLNDDTEVIHGDWLLAMMEHGRRERVGAVGALLTYPDDTIQHAGVVLGFGGLCGHAFAGADVQQPGYFGLALAVRNASAVTAACMLVRRSLFLDVGGFDEENLAEAYQDVDFCLRVVQSGRRIVYTPHARLTHHESSSKNVSQLIVSEKEAALLRLRWSKLIADDPFYSPNLTRARTTYEIRIG